MTYWHITGPNTVTDVSLSLLHNDFQHITTLKVDYLGLVFVGPLHVSLGLKHRRFSGYLTQ